MLVSISCFQTAIIQYNKAKKHKEDYSVGESTGGGVSAGLATGMLVVAILFMTLEFLVLFFAIGVALKCTKSGPERIVHLVLAIIFTLPYMLLNVFFNKCAVNMLRGGSEVVQSPNTIEASFGFANKMN
jgi:NADH:ubiquinone oxidoreductase subunit 3 (subunit A)